jgi:nicotinamide-nucleotide amidase
MLAELLTIGDEILIGQIVNTNAVWMAKQLNAIGVQIKQITSISDDKAHIKNALDEALNRADLILITGGLGPTKDDITKNTLSEYFGVGLKKEMQVLNFIKEGLEKRGIEFLPVHELQALILDNSELLFNHYGTAPGMWIEHKGKIVVCMPGVPHEMKGIMSNYVLPKISKQFNLPFIFHKTIVVIGLSESKIADAISEVEDNLPNHIKLAYLPNFGIVRLRLSGIGKNEALLTEEIEANVLKILRIIPSIHIAATDDLKPEQIIGKLLTETGKTLATAESCTGGYISHLITSIPGSSNYFIGSLIAYSNAVKINHLGVNPKTLQNFGAVSEECVTEMAAGIKNRFKTDFAISTTGIAGPTGATEEKPVGLVWIAVAGPKGIETRKLLANGERINVIERTTIVALDMLRRMITESSFSSL